MIVSLFSSVVLVILGALSLYWGFFSLWHRFEQENIDEIDKLFDAVLVSLLGGVLVGRVAQVFLTWPLTMIRPLEFFSGLLHLNVPIAVGVGLLLLFTLTKKNWRDHIHLLDLAVVSLALLIGLFSLTHGVWIVVRGILSQRTDWYMPAAIALSAGLVAIASSKLLARLELEYRTFVWYRYRRSSAQSGFVVAAFCICIGVWSLVRGIALTGIGSVSAVVTLVSSLLCILAGFVILYIRSGRIKGKTRT